MVPEQEMAGLVAFLPKSLRDSSLFATVDGSIGRPTSSGWRSRTERQPLLRRSTSPEVSFCIDKTPQLRSIPETCLPVALGGANKIGSTRMPISVSMIILSSQLVVPVADGVPVFDIARSCKLDVAASAGLSDNQSLKACISDEN